jgi:hypothetical protein
MMTALSLTNPAVCPTRRSIVALQVGKCHLLFGFVLPTARFPTHRRNTNLFRPLRQPNHSHARLSRQVCFRSDRAKQSSKEEGYLPTNPTSRQHSGHSSLASLRSQDNISSSCSVQSRRIILTPRTLHVVHPSTSWPSSETLRPSEARL